LGCRTEKRLRQGLTVVGHAKPKATARACREREQLQPDSSSLPLVVEGLGSVGGTSCTVHIDEDFFQFSIALETNCLLPRRLTMKPLVFKTHSISIWMAFRMGQLP
jgi:hypothetical protein